MTPTESAAPSPLETRIDVRMVRDTYPVCMECGERRCFHFGRSEYCTPEGFQTGNGNCYNPSDEEPPVYPVALTRAELVDALATLTRQVEALTGERGQALELLALARRNVEHSASHAAGGKSRELLAEIDTFLARAALAGKEVGSDG